MSRQEHYRMLKEQIDIRDYARYLGYTVVKRGRYYSLKEHDSVRIDPEKNCFWRNSKPGHGGSFGAGGSIIDFVMEFTGSGKAETLKALEKYLHVVPERCMFPVKKEKTDKLILPTAAPNMKRVFAYLIQTRKIGADIVQELVHKRQLYQDVNGNCVFVSYDNDKPVFACRRGTNTEKPFYGDVEGCDYRKGFYLNFKAEKLYITEAVIDALSVMTIKGRAFREWNYLAVAGGGKWEAVSSYLAGVKEIWIGTDNDDTGKKAADRIENYVNANHPDICIIRDFPNKKDWNMELTEGAYHDCICGK